MRRRASLAALLSALLLISACGSDNASAPADGERVEIAGAPAPINGPFSSVPAVCRTFTHEPGNGMAWFYPVRLDMDLLLGVPDLRPSAVSEFLGLRPFHLATLDLPLYVFETGLSQGGVLPAAQRLVAESSIGRFESFSDQAMGHLDPLEDFPGHNRFFETVVPFLRALVGG